jgi:hypothetical protein
MSVLSLAKFITYFPEGDRREIPHRLRRYAFPLLIGSLTVPTSCELSQNSGSFPAMKVKGRVKISPLTIIREALPASDMIGKLTAEIIVENTLGEPGKEFLREDRELLPARKPADCPLHIERAWPKQ